MIFIVTGRFSNISNAAPDTVLLTWDNWNDYSYYTLFGIEYKDTKSRTHDLGNVRIGHFGQVTVKRPLAQGDQFPQLGPDYFSLGSGTEYYENLNKLHPDTRRQILTGLRDLALFPDLLEKAKDEEVTKTSLLRGLDLETVRGQYRRMALGGARLTAFRFSFESPPISSNSPKMELSFKVVPESNPPTNVHVIIGRNGVGKTHMINNMVGSLYHAEEAKYGQIYFNERDEDVFVNVVFVSYSAFDASIPFFDTTSETTRMKFRYIGLKKPDTTIRTGFSIKSAEELAEEFISSFMECMESFKTETLRQTLTALESDYNFQEANIVKLLELKPTEVREIGPVVFKKLSSGHKIILLSITRLVETVQEKSLVFIDEPEAHLHPPLLSAFTRALSELLTKVNGVAIIATHSPVVLQEVPRSCVYKLYRVGANASAQRPEIETFGENVGVLTREVFTLEVTESGFYQLLKKAVAELEDYDALLEHFDDRLGMEARSLARVLFANKQS